MTDSTTSTNSVLIELARQVRGRTVMILEAASESELLWSPPGLVNHMLWHAGHAAWLADALAIAAITGATELPAQWAKVFGSRGTPVGQIKDWPSRQNVASVLARQLERLVELIEALDAARLAAPPRDPALGDTRTTGGWIIHALHDEAYHSGEMRLLLKVQRAGPRASNG